MSDNINSILHSQREFFKSGKTLHIKFRIDMLKRLYSVVKRREDQIGEALYKDLGKSEFESYMCETGLLLSEISHMIKHTKKFAKKKRVSTPLSQFPAKSYKQPTPLGNVLIISPWNYPLLLTLEPLANAIAAGNTAILKPSAYSPNTSKVLAEIIEECFPKEYIALIQGGRKENSTLLSKKFDLVFFTGSRAVGKEVLRHTAENLTPAILELGGKSPCIVDESANIPLTAKRIVFGKYLNCGQTCVAPDYILCHKSIKDRFTEELKKQIVLQFGSSPLDNESYGKIINQKHFERLVCLLDNSDGEKQESKLSQNENAHSDNSNSENKDTGLCQSENATPGNSNSENKDTRLCQSENAHSGNSDGEKQESKLSQNENAHLGNSNSKIIFGGKYNLEKLKIEPTIVKADENSKIMEDEIFGPILPILTYENIDEVINFVCNRPKPLALYIFSQNKKNINLVTTRTQYGGGCINDVIIHLATTEMGFGGVGESGMGEYHGKAGFDAFTHYKSIVNKKSLDLPMRYQPYKKGLMEKLVRMFLK